MAPASRRGFLRGLTTLPLIGGSVALIGAPTAVAEPVSPALILSYDAWLYYERWKLKLHGIYPDLDYVPSRNNGFRWQQEEGITAAPLSRAALVLATVGCDWRESGL